MGFCFISFSTKDQVYADKLLNVLENDYKIKCFICYRDLIGGLSYAVQLDEAIQQCSCVVYLHSNNADQSEHVKREIELASKYMKTIIPCKLDETKLGQEIEYTLNRVHWIDFMGFENNQIATLANSIIAVMGSPYKKAISKIYDLLLEMNKNGASPEILQNLVWALNDAVERSLPSETKKIKKLYNNYVNELQDIIKNHNGDVANHHDKLLKIVNDISTYCRNMLIK